MHQGEMVITFGTMCYGCFLEYWREGLRKLLDSGEPCEFYDAAQDLYISIDRSGESERVFEISISYTHAENVPRSGYGEVSFTTRSFECDLSDIVDLRESIREFIVITQIDTRHWMEIEEV